MNRGAELADGDEVAEPICRRLTLSLAAVAESAADFPLLRAWFLRGVGYWLGRMSITRSAEPSQGPDNDAPFQAMLRLIERLSGAPLDAAEREAFHRGIVAAQARYLEIFLNRFVVHPPWSNLDDVIAESAKNGITVKKVADGPLPEYSVVRWP